MDIRLEPFPRGGFQLIPGFLGIASILFWRRLKEIDLESRFGEDYRRDRAQSWF